jgi:Xaa-Pro aminopeptidase
MIKNIKNRLSTLQKKLANHQAILLTNYQDIFYFSLYQQLVPEEREAFLLISKKQVYLIHASFSPVQKIKFISNLKGAFSDKLQSHLKKVCPQNQISEILIDENSLFVEEHNKLKQIPNVELKNLDNSWTYEIRAIKDKQEIKLIKQACLISKKALETTFDQLRTGITELQLAHILKTEMEQLGSSKEAFPTIVAFGSNSALPHHQPTNKKLKKNMAVLVDFGANLDNYLSDMTRSVWFGDKPDPDFKKVEQIVKQAYQAALNTIKEKLNPTAKQVDTAAREIIQKAGFGKNYIHTSGHGVGLSVHEPPSLSWMNQQTVKNNMVVTIEPGIYLENKFGYRYENTVLVKKKNALELTQ